MGIVFGLKYMKLLRLARVSHLLWAWAGSTVVIYPMTRAYVGWTGRDHYMNEYAVIVKRLRNVQVR